jgi:hypothetical protein
MAAYQRTVGITRRGPTDPRARRRHARTELPASRTGRNMLAVCGASVVPRPLRGLDDRPMPFDPADPLACPRCVKVLDR